MARGTKTNRVERGLVALEPVKLDLVGASDAADREIRSCATCDARCCRVGFNSMRISRIEAVALARRLRRPDLAPLVSEVLARARKEAARRGLAANPDAKYDCPLLTEEGRCLVHGEAQPAGCLTYKPVDDGGCDHDLRRWRKASPRIETAERVAFGRVSPPLPIPLALLAALRPAGRGPGRRGDP